MSDARKWTWEQAWSVVRVAASEGLLPGLAEHNFYYHQAVAGATEYTNRLRAQLNDLFQGQLLVRITGPVWPGDHNRAGLNFFDRVAGEWVLPDHMRKVLRVRG